eukprot:4757039-Alexandrium_andersonii.AAC.1
MTRGGHAVKWPRTPETRVPRHLIYNETEERASAYGMADFGWRVLCYLNAPPVVQLTVPTRGAELTSCWGTKQAERLRERQTEKQR